MSADNADRPAYTVIRRAGVASWSMLGVIAMVAVVAAALTAVSGIVIPLVIAVILGVLLEPISQALRRVGVPSVLAAAVTLLTAVIVAVGTTAVVAWGFVRQWPEIRRRLAAGWTQFVEWAASLDIETRWFDHVRSVFEGHAPQLGQGILGAVTSTFYGALSLVIGTFLAAFFLFFTLRDADRFPSWVARTTTLDLAEVDVVVALTRQSVRGYFKGTAITALITAPVFMIPLLLLGVPLAIPIFVLYFVLSFIPFLGAWITGIFAVLIAFGSGGPTAAAILGVTFVMSNGTVQSVVSSWALGSSLRLHPVAVLLATMIGGTVAGLLGMVLGAPMLAAIAKSAAAVRRLRAEDGGSSA